MAKQPVGVSLATMPRGAWVQTERLAHEKWAVLTTSAPRAAALLHLLISKMGRHNAIIASQANIARLAGCSVRTVQRSIATLQAQKWIEVRQIGAAGTACAYIVNDRVAWTGNRDGIRYSLFSAAVLVSDDEQPDRDEIGAQVPLMQIPEVSTGEMLLPSGEGLPPPVEQFLPELAPALPTKPRDEPDFENMESATDLC